MSPGGESADAALTFGRRGSPPMPADWICSRPSGNGRPMRHLVHRPEPPLAGMSELTLLLFPDTFRKCVVTCDTERV